MAERPEEWGARVDALEAEALGVASPVNRECATLGHARGRIIGRVALCGPGGFSAPIVVCARCGQWYSPAPAGTTPRGSPTKARKGESRRKA